MPAPVLLTIPVSHYCEKARWALDRAGVRYVERGHLPVVSRLFTTPRGGGSVPMLVTPHGTLKDSNAIVAFADRRLPAAERLLPEEPGLREEVSRLVERFDRLGVATRAFAYSYLLDERDVLERFATQGVPPVERLAARPLLPVLARMMRKGLRIGPTTRGWARGRIEEEIAFVGERLADGRRYLAGDRFTAADVAWAALLAPVVVPEEYGGPLPSIAELPAEMAAEVRRFRETPAGAFASELYREARPAPESARRRGQAEGSTARPAR